MRFGFNIVVDRRSTTSARPHSLHQIQGRSGLNLARSCLELELEGAVMAFRWRRMRMGKESGAEEMRNTYIKEGESNMARGKTVKQLTKWWEISLPFYLHASVAVQAGQNSLSNSVLDVNDTFSELKDL